MLLSLLYRWQFLLHAELLDADTPTYKRPSTMFCQQKKTNKPAINASSPKLFQCLVIAGVTWVPNVTDSYALSGTEARPGCVVEVSQEEYEMLMRWVRRYWVHKTVITVKFVKRCNNWVHLLESIVINIVFPFVSTRIICLGLS